MIKENNMVTQGSKEELKGVGGWLSFFIFTLVVSIVIDFIVGIEDISSVVSATDILTSSKIWLGTLDVLFFAGIIGFIMYTIYSLSTLKPNAVSLAKMALVMTFTNNLLLVIFTSISGQEIPESTIFSNSSVLIRSLIFSVIWFWYLSVSKRVKNTYPPQTRKTYTIDKILFFGILAIPIVIYLIGFIGLAAQNSTVMNISQSFEIKRALVENEYSDGRIFFKKPLDLEIKKEYIGVAPVFVLSKDEDMSITLVSDLLDTDHKKYFDEFYNEAYDGLSQGYELDYTVLKEEQTTNANGLEYIKKSIRIDGEDTIIWTLMILFDNSSNKIAGISYFSPKSKNSVYSQYLGEVTNSIKFS